MRDVALDPGGTTGLHREAACVAFDAFDRLGFRDVPHFVAHPQHPTQLLCTLGGSVTGSSRNTHYLVGAAPYPGLPEIHPASPTQTAAAESV